MIRSVVDAHVISARHVTLFALGARADIEQDLAVFGSDRLACFALTLVEVVVFGIVEAGPVALQAQGIAFLDALCAMNIVTVAAADAACVHLALHK